MATEIETDVLIIGGGPGGSTAATLLARKGWRVTLVEKDRHPRFHIGESLLPTNLPLLERLGVSDAVRAIAVIKRGADFPAANDAGYHVFRFADMARPISDHAYQIRREQFDQILFDHAKSVGVHTLQGTRIVETSLDSQKVTAHAESPDGTVLAISARYLIDASGRDTFLGNRLQLKQRHPKHQSAALFAHFSGVQRRSDEDAGNISIYRFAHGWVWMIPLPNDIMSIGAVCSPEYLKRRAGDNATFLWDTLRGIEGVTARLTQARMVGHLHATGNYSYVCRRWCGSRWLMVGDACAFLDPIFSTGVFLAMHSAERAAELVDHVLRNPELEARLQAAYVRELQAGLKTFSWYICRFTSPAMAWLFANPRDVGGVQAALISMLGGDVFNNHAVMRRLTIFRVLYRVRWILTARQNFAGWLARRRQQRSHFRGGTTLQDSQ